MARTRLIAGALALLVIAAGAIALLVDQAARRDWASTRRAHAHLDAETRAEALAAHFDRELGRAHLWFQVDTGSLTDTEWEDFAWNHEKWINRAPYPALIRDWYVARPRRSGILMQRFDAADEVLTEVAWPRELEPFHAAVEAEWKAGDGDVLPSLGPIAPDVPALVLELWLPDAEPELADPSAPPPPRPYAYVIGTLDLDFVVGSLLPALAREHLGEGFGYRVVAADDARHEITSSFSGGPPPGVSPDAEATLLAIPLAGLDEPMLDPPAPGPDAGALAKIAPRRGEDERERGAWRVLVYRPAASNSEAIARQQRAWSLSATLALVVMVAAALGLAALVLARGKHER